MNGLRCDWISAENEQTDFGQLSLDQALVKFDSVNWPHEAEEGERTGQYPRLGLTAGPDFVNNDGYLYITPDLGEPTFAIYLVGLRPKRLLGLIPYRSMNDCWLYDVEEADVISYIRQIYARSSDDWYELAGDKALSRNAH